MSEVEGARNRKPRMSWKGGVKKVFECLVLERQGACEADKGWSELEQCGM